MQVQSIPNFITASSPEDLQREMLNIQAGMNMFFQFRDIQQMKNGKWIAWFDVPLSRLKESNGTK